MQHVKLRKALSQILDLKYSFKIGLELQSFLNILNPPIYHGGPLYLLLVLIQKIE